MLNIRNYSLLLTLLLSFSCKDNPKTVSGELASTFSNDTISSTIPQEIEDESTDGNLKSIKDVDSVSVNSSKAEIKRTVGNNHFSMSIELPHCNNRDTEHNILYWINHNLETDVVDANYEKDVVVDSASVERQDYGQKYAGDLNDLKSLLNFYADKHFILYRGDRLGIDYSVDCKKIFENKDIVSFEITEYFTNYAIMKTMILIRGASFFKFNGKQLSWAYFENSNVKNIVKKEINRQYLKFSARAYEDFLASTRYQEFSLPNNPPYMTKNGLRFFYNIQELSPNEQDGQISCVIQPENLSVMPSLLEMLK